MKFIASKNFVVYSIQLQTIQKNYKHPCYLLINLFPCRYARMIRSKHTDYDNILHVVETNRGNEVVAGPVREFTSSREKFTIPIQESCSSATSTGMLV